MILSKIYHDKEKGRKSLAVLLDPDHLNHENCIRLINYAVECKVDYFFVGGSLIANSELSNAIELIKENCNIPVLIFPGSNMHIDSKADGILLLSLISGRNPDLLIGQHVIAAPILKKSGLEILSTGYILIDSGKQTTVSYISNTTPIPADKPDIAACTALAGEMLGQKLIYLDAGSGAKNQVSPKTIHKVRKAIEIPMIVGGGINSIQKMQEAFDAGADIIVIGNHIESNPDFIIQAAEKVQVLNQE